MRHLSDCPSCWDTPCTCRSPLPNYITSREVEKDERIAALESALAQAREALIKIADEAAPNDTRIRSFDYIYDAARAAIDIKEQK